MNYTTNLNLKLPASTDNYNIQNFNDNAITIDAEIVKKASSTQDGRMSKEDKSKLDQLPTSLKAGTGTNSLVSGQYSIATGSNARADGYKVAATTNNSHAEGNYTLACNGGQPYKVLSYDNTLKKLFFDSSTSVAFLSVGSNLTLKRNDDVAIDDVPITVIDSVNNAVTLNTTANITTVTHAIKKFATQFNTHAEGQNTLATGHYSHAEGINTIAVGEAAHSEGSNTMANGGYAHAEGVNTVASQSASHAEGEETTARGVGSHAEGKSTIASGFYAHTEGLGTTNSCYASLICGKYGDSPADYSFALGNGTSSSNKGLAAKILTNGNAYCDGTWAGGGADYAEMFEWLDGNPDNEDRVGYFVTLEGDKIRIASDQDEYILGIVSANPTIIGDSGELRWKNKYVTDEWERIQYEDIEVKFEKEEKPHIERQPIINPEWRSEEIYISRLERKEWSAVGLKGKLLVRDDGTCQANGYCKSNEEGIATAISESDIPYFRVLKRISDNIVQVMLL